MKVEICAGKTCRGRFSSYIAKRLENDIQKFDLKKVEVSECLCSGNCKEGPNVFFDGKREAYMNPAKTAKKVFDSVKK